jgi:hypothetical protein
MQKQISVTDSGSGRIDMQALSPSAARTESLPTGSLHP